MAINKTHLAIVATITALAVVNRKGPVTLPYFPAPSFLTSPIEYCLNLFTALGTPFFAWHLAHNRSNNNVTISISIVSAIAATVYTFVPFLHIGASLLWAAMGAWWMAGLLLVPPEQQKKGLSWIRTVITMKVVEILQRQAY
ncbi:hypothetical protein F5884DRAFT_270854 [Xylogone sp. PMI_703]|nr:hypothetical protein F5884DRAFT_270854 [Xylogone sp. PMI_703]